MNRGTRSGNTRDPQVSNLAGRPLGPTMNTTTQKNSGSDSLANRDKNEISLSLCCSPMEFALGCQVCVVINYHPALDLPCQHRPQRNVVPILQRTQSDDRSFLYVHNRR